MIWRALVFVVLYRGNSDTLDNRHIALCRELKRWREAEVTHGRVAMLAALGFIVQVFLLLAIKEGSSQIWILSWKAPQVVVGHACSIQSTLHIMDFNTHVDACISNCRSSWRTSPDHSLTSEVSFSSFSDRLHMPLQKLMALRQLVLCSAAGACGCFTVAGAVAADMHVSRPVPKWSVTVRL